MTTIFVTDAHGREHAVDAPDDRLLMEVLRTAGLDIKGSCEASLSCGTCHVHIDPAFTPLLELPNEEEAGMIDMTDDATAQSRFSCQIRINPRLEGLRLAIPG